MAIGGSAPTTPNKSSRGSCSGRDRVKARSHPGSPNPVRGLPAGDGNGPSPSTPVPRRGLPAMELEEQSDMEASSVTSPVAKAAVEAMALSRHDTPARNNAIVRRRIKRNDGRSARRISEQSSVASSSGASLVEDRDEQFQRYLRRSREQVARQQVTSVTGAVRSPEDVQKEVEKRVLLAELNSAKGRTATNSGGVGMDAPSKKAPLGTRRKPGNNKVPASVQLPTGMAGAAPSGAGPTSYAKKASAAKRFQIVKNAVGASANLADFQSVKDQLKRLILSPDTKLAVQLERVYFSEGKVHLTSKDKVTEDWLRRATPKLKGPGEGHPGYRFLGPGDLPPLHKVFANISKTEAENKKTAMGYLRKQNPSVSLRGAFALGWYEHEKYSTLYLGLDANAFKQLQDNDMSMFCGLGCIKFKSRGGQRSRAVPRKQTQVMADHSIPREIEMVMPEDSVSAPTANIAGAVVHTTVGNDEGARSNGGETPPREEMGPPSTAVPAEGSVLTPTANTVAAAVPTNVKDIEGTVSGGGGTHDIREETVASLAPDPP